MPCSQVRNYYEDDDGVVMVVVMVIKMKVVMKIMMMVVIMVVMMGLRIWATQQLS